MRRNRSGLIIFLIAGGFAGISLWPENAMVQAEESLPTILCTQAPKIGQSSETHEDSGLREGARVVKKSPGQPVQMMTPGFVVAARPRVAFDAGSILFIGRKEGTPRTGVWEMGVDGQNPREIVHCEGDCVQAEYLSTFYSLEDVAPSRRVAFTCQPGNGRPPQIFTCRLDGSDVRQITFLPTGALDPIALPDGRLWFRSSGLSTSFLVQTDGTDLTAYELEEQKKFGVDRPKVQARLQDGRLVESRWLEERKSWGIVVLDSGGSQEVLYDTDGNELDPVLVAPHPQPAGHSSVVRETLDAELFCLDAAIIGERRDEGRLPALVRLWEATPTQDSTPAERLLGDFLVEDDGSFFIEVPPRTPIRLELLGLHQESIGSMKSWTWVMPGERRGCIGCHENPLMTPPNRHVLALRKPAQKLRNPAGVEDARRPIVRGGIDSQP